MAVSAALTCNKAKAKTFITTIYDILDKTQNDENYGWLLRSIMQMTGHYQSNS
ncbi:MAG: hypothetical protein PHN45_00835 [Methylococcales bacterium]|nr:hypothetical protein [Methylococcales bacterium]